MITPEVRAARHRRLRIVRNHQVFGGEPTVIGAHVSVPSIVVGHSRCGGDLARVGEAYRLDVELVRDAVAYHAEMPGESVDEE